MKEAAITCVGVTVAELGDVMGAATSRALGLLLERLRNEITRLAAVKALTRVAQSGLKTDLAAVAPAAGPRQNDTCHVVGFHMSRHLIPVPRV